MSVCAVCGNENRDATYVLMIRRDGSEAEMCDDCRQLMEQLENDSTRKSALAALKKHAKGCGDYEVRRFLDGVISSCDDPDSFNSYIEETRQRRKGGGNHAPRDLHRLVRPASLVLLITVAAYGIFRAVLDFSAGAVAAGVIGIILTAVIDGSLFVILADVMDSLDDVRMIRKHIR